MRRDASTRKNGFTLGEILVVLFIITVLLAGLMEFFIATLVSLQSSQSELATAQETREAVQMMKKDAKDSDYLLAYPDVASIDADDELGRGERGNVVPFVTNQEDDDIYDTVDAAFESVVAYFLEADAEEGSLLQRLEIENAELQTGETIPEMVTRVINSADAQPRVITEDFQGALDGDLFYLFRSDSVVVNGAIRDGNGRAEFRKTINLTLNVSTT